MTRFLNKKSLIQSTALWALIFIFSLPSLAYIPKSQTIIDHLVQLHGKGAYVIEQDVVFPQTQGSLIGSTILKEKWTVENGEALRLEVSGTKDTGDIHFEAVYHNGKVTFTQENGVTTQKVKPEFFEGFFHTRSKQGFVDALQRANIAPAALTAEATPTTSLENLKLESEPFVQLGRGGGTIAWIIGEPNVDPTGRPQPAVWVEQDEFRLLKLRFPSTAEVIANQYAGFSGGLSFPRERLISWGNNKIVIRIKSIRSIALSQAAKVLNPTTLTQKKTSPSHLPELEIVREFYSRFR